ncbi:MAG: cytochrome c oxidase subunit 3 [Rhodospirillaceae bacterium]|nr:cytochrome c oxidase subunit 3 [Rhodospirillaceae bacterium]
MRTHVVHDLPRLPPYGFGRVSTMWWGTLGYIALEGMGFALGLGTYFYLAYHAQRWPLGAAPPVLWPATLLLVVLLASIWPNLKVDRDARNEDLPRVRRGLVLMSAIGLLTLAIRAFEITLLHPRWDANAYGSILWVLVGLHTLHLLTDVGDTIVVTVLMFTRHGHGRRFSDVSDNAFYWYFIIGSWALLYVVLYWAPRT